MILLYLELVLGFTLQIYLALLMRRVGAQRQFRVFYSWILFSFIKTPPLFLLFCFGTTHQYFVAYWCVQAAEFIWRMVALYEIFSDCCGDLRTRNALLLALVAVLLAAIWLSWVDPFRSSDAMIRMAVRLSRSMSIVQWLWFVAVVITIKSCKVRLRVRGRGLLAGLGISTGGDLAYAALFGVFGWASIWCIQVSRLAYFLAVYVWIDHLRRPNEPSPISRESALRLLRRMRELLPENERMSYWDL